MFMISQFYMKAIKQIYCTFHLRKKLKKVMVFEKNVISSFSFFFQFGAKCQVNFRKYDNFLTDFYEKVKNDDR